MSAERELHYFCKPAGDLPVAAAVDVLPTDQFLADEPACKALWEFVSTQFRTRHKFLSIWPSVRHVALHRDEGGAVDGLLLVSAPVNWQIDYVVVKPESRGKGIAASLVRATLNHARRHGAPYVMLTSKASLRPLYEGCGFVVVGDA